MWSIYIGFGTDLYFPNFLFFYEYVCECQLPHPTIVRVVVVVLSNTGPDPLKNHKATKPAFNVGQSSAHQRNANGVSLAGR